MNKSDKDDSKEAKDNNYQRSNNVTMKEMMNLLSEHNPNPNSALGDNEMDKEQLIESFLLFQKFMNLNMAINKNNKNDGMDLGLGIAEGSKEEEEGEASKRLQGNKMIENEINEITIENYKENVPESQIGKEREKENKEQIDKVKDNKKQTMEEEGKEQYDDTYKQSNRNNEGNINSFNQYDQEAVNNNVDDNPIEDNANHNNNISNNNKEDQMNSNANEQIEKSLSNFLSESKKPTIPIPTTIQNQYDEIPIKPLSGNFMELLEQSLQHNEQFQAPIESKKKIIKKQPQVPKKQIVISKPSKEEIKKYTYYSDNFEDEEKTIEEIEKEKKKKIRDQQVQLEQQIQQKQSHLAERQGFQILNKKEQLAQDKKGIKMK